MSAVRMGVWFSLGAALIGAGSYVSGQVQRGGEGVEQRDGSAPVGSSRNPLRASSGVVAGLLQHHEMPKYPMVRCDDPAKEGGAKVMHALISPEGKVKPLEWMQGPEAYREPVMDAVELQTLSFEPARRCGCSSLQALRSSRDPLGGVHVLYG